MADVQVEHGHTRIAHPILEALAVAPFNAAQLKVLLVVIRETYGWQRKDAPISYTHLEAATGLHRDTVRNALRTLIREGVVTVVREATFTSPAVYQLQKDPQRWGRFRTHSVTHVQVDESQGVGQESHTPVGLLSHTPVGQSSHTQGVQVIEISSTSGGLKIMKDNERYTPPSSLPRTHTRDARETALDRLRTYLGPHAEAADRFAASADHSATWAAAILGLYGPEGTDTQVWQRSPPEDRPALLARALDRYAGEGKRYHGKLFRRFLEDVIHEHCNDDRRANDHRRGPAANGRGAAKGARAVGLGAGDPSRRSGWVYE